MITAAILVIEDERIARENLTHVLTNTGYEVTALASAEEGVRELEKREFDLVITDLMLPGMDGIELLEHVRAHHPLTIVIVVTGHATVANAVKAMQKGAHSYIAKPLKLDELRLQVERALEQHALSVEVLRLREIIAQGKSDLPPGGPERRHGPAQEGRPPAGPDELQRAHPGRDRHRQGAGGPGHPHGLAARGRAVHGHQLRHLHRRAHGQGAVRPRKGGVHGRQPGAEGHFGGRGRRHGIFRRDRRAAPEHAGQAAPGAPGSATSCAWAGTKEIPVDIRVIAATNCDLQELVQKGEFPPGPLLPAERGHPARPAPARAPRGHPDPDRPFPGKNTASRGSPSTPSTRTPWTS